MAIKLRKLSLEQRLKTLNIPPHIRSFIASNAQQRTLADRYVENAIGTYPLPLGMVEELIVDSTPYTFALATEEASVIAATNYGAKIAGSIYTQCDHALQVAQISLTHVTPQGEHRLLSQLAPIKDMLMARLASLHRRGGGLRDVSCARITKDIFVVYVTVDVCDAQGANIVNDAVEHCTPLVERQCGGTVLASICSNHNPQRLVHAQAHIPFSALPHSQTLTSKTLAEKIHLLSQWAHHDIYRATTHNKGIMNGVSALAIATGNDFRALEAAAYTYVSLNENKPLSRYHIQDEMLVSHITLPALCATKGGATSHPVAAWNLSLLASQCPKEFHAHHLNRIMAAVGLAQNLAALRALADEGIQKGHMRLHKKKNQESPSKDFSQKIQTQTKKAAKETAKTMKQNKQHKNTV